MVSVHWGVADPIRDTFERGKYRDVVPPFTVVRRPDCVLAATKGKLLARSMHEGLRGNGLNSRIHQHSTPIRWAFDAQHAVVGEIRGVGRETEHEA